MNTVTSAPFGARHAAAPPVGPAGEGDGDAWSAFAAASCDADYCRSWLALQCTAVPGVRAGLLLVRAPGSQSFVPAAVWPDARRDVSYLTEVAERALTSRRGAVLGLEPEERERMAAGTLHVAYPVETEGEVHGAVVVDLAARPEAQEMAPVM